jgi:hypothetical protein
MRWIKNPLVAFILFSILLSSTPSTAAIEIKSILVPSQKIIVDYHNIDAGMLKNITTNIDPGMLLPGNPYIDPGMLIAP